MFHFPTDAHSFFRNYRLGCQLTTKYDNTVMNDSCKITGVPVSSNSLSEGIDFMASMFASVFKELWYKKNKQMALLLEQLKPSSGK